MWIQKVSYLTPVMSVCLMLLLACTFSLTLNLWLLSLPFRYAILDPGIYISKVKTSTMDSVPLHPPTLSISNL